MKLRRKSVRLWLGAAAILAALMFTASPAGADPGNNPNNPGQGDEHRTIPTPEPTTLALLALGGGAVALARYRSSRRK